MSKLSTETGKLAMEAGLDLIELPNGHFQLRGRDDVLVYYWPGSKNRTAIRNDGVLLDNCTPEQAIQLCLSGMPQDAPGGSPPPASPPPPWRRSRRKPDIIEWLQIGAIWVAALALIVMAVRS